MGVSSRRKTDTIRARVSACSFLLRHIEEFAGFRVLDAGVDLFLQFRDMRAGGCHIGLDLIAEPDIVDFGHRRRAQGIHGRVLFPFSDQPFGCQEIKPRVRQVAMVSVRVKGPCA